MGLAGMSHHPPPPLPSPPLSRPEDHRSRETIFSLLHSPPRLDEAETCPRQGAFFQAHGRSNSSRVCGLLRGPLHGGKKETRGRVGGQLFRPLSTIQRAYTARNTGPKTGSTDRFREPHAPSDPGTHTTAPPPFPLSSSSIHPHSLAFLARRLRPRRCSSHECVSSKARASKVSAPLSSCRLEAATSATRPRDPHRMWAVSCFTYHAIFQAWDGMHHRRWKYIQPGRIEFDFEEGMIV